MKTVNIDSDPQGARVYYAPAINEQAAEGLKNYIGTTPFSWQVQPKGPGEFDYPHAFVYSGYVPSVVVFTAVPQSTNFPPMKKVFHGKVMFGPPPEKIPDGIFFDFKNAAVK